MSICEKCVKLKPIQLCIDQLVIGKAEPNTRYTVWFESLANNSLWGFNVLSDSAGVLTLDLDTGFPLSSYTLFKMWISIPGGNMFEAKELLIGANIGFCFHIHAVKANDIGYPYVINPVIETLQIQ